MQSPATLFAWRVASDWRTPPGVQGGTASADTSANGGVIFRLATPLRTVVSSAQAALNLARRPPATRDRAMHSPIVARDVGGFPGKKQCVLNRTR